MNKSILIIGGSGFLGSALAATLRKNRVFKVTTASRNEAFKLDLIKDDVVAKTRGFDVLINLTGQVSQPIQHCLELNSIGVQKLIESAQKNRQRLIQASTTLVYGPAKTVDESSPLNPQSPYSTAKALAELLIQHQLPTDQYLITRFSNLYGENQTKGMLWYLINCIKKNKPVIITDNDGTLTRNYLHVSDAAEVMKQLIDMSASGMVNAIGPDKYSIKELVAQCESLLDKSIETSYAQITSISNIDRIKTNKLNQLVSVKWQHSVRRFLKTALL